MVVPSGTNLIQTSSLTMLASSVAVHTLDGAANETALLVSILPATEPDQAELGEKVRRLVPPTLMCALARLHDRAAICSAQMDTRQPRPSTIQPESSLEAVR